jgi:methylenetetrahydrofolate dehydrogenase (NADP+)/methenyltetrahydrofolate cyclohydrolase
MQLLDGKTAEDIKSEIVLKLKNERMGKVPHLAAVIVGNDGASLTYRK